MGDQNENYVMFSPAKLPLEGFLCGSCENILKPPIMIVETLGNVCGTCYVADCIGLRNTQLELVLNSLEIPCKYQKFGCKQRLLYKDLENHNCIYKSKPCLVKCSCCKWERPQIELLQHILDQHTEYVVNGVDNKFCFEIQLNDHTDLWRFLKKETINFLFNIKTDKANDRLLYKVVSTSEADCPKLNMILTGSNASKIELECKSLLFPETYSLEDKHQSINYTATKQVIQMNGKLKLEITSGKVDEKVKPLDLDILQCMECPICTNVMKPPIYQCVTGHSVCDVCKPKLKECPTCLQPFGNVRNYSLEQIVEKNPFPCIYSNLGCKEVLPGAKIRDHENSCFYQTSSCPICTFDCQLSIMMHHLVKSHTNAEVTFSDSYVANLPPMDELTDTETFIRFFVHEDRMFKLTLDRKIQKFHWHLEDVFGNAINLYKYKIKIYNPLSAKAKLSFCANRIYKMKPNKQPFNSIKVTFDKIGKIFAQPQHLVYCCKIIKTNPVT